MSKATFLFKEENTDDRDCVNYIEIGRIGRLECDHYFPSINVVGACFSKSLNIKEFDYENIKTVLTKEEMIKLNEYAEAISELGYGIKAGDERYNKGVELTESIKPIIAKLLSEKNDEVFEQVIEEEKEYLKDEYSLDDEDIDKIFDEYTLEYRDRGIVAYVYNRIEEAAEEEAESLGYVTKENERYFDYEKFGEDLLDNESYIELNDGRIVRLNY